MRILGLDLSTASAPTVSRTGWALLDGERLLAAGKIPADTRGWLKHEPFRRYCLIAAEILRVVQDYEPGWVYAEAPWSGKFANATLALGRLQGAVTFALQLADREINFLQPKEWRRLIGVSSARGKLNGIALVEGWLASHGLPFSAYSEDEMEAIGIALAGREELRRDGL